MSDKDNGANDDVPFNRDYPLKPGVVDQVRPNVRRVLCNNPSPFTFTGTNSYIVGTGKVAIIDPGPANDAHLQALLDAVKGETVTHIFVTHTHSDHSPNTAALKAATGQPRSMPKARTAPRGRASRARNIRRNPAPTATSSRTCWWPTAT
jgi:glyoxylase-like metal-dependent hydrolase (beta-lactamase superfamily II)